MAPQTGGNQLSDSLKRGGLSPDELLQEAFREHQCNRYVEAEGRYRKILEIDPGHFDALHLLGILAHQTGRSVEAAEHIARALERVPDDSSALTNLAEIYRVLGRVPEGKACCLRVLDASPRHCPALLNLALLCEAEGDFNAALGYYEEASSLEPDRVQAHCGVGKILYRLGKWEAARSRLEQALVLHPNAADVLNNLGTILMAQGHLLLAVARFRAAAEARSGFAEAHFNLGNALRAQGKREEACAAYRSALAARPGFADAHVNLGNILKEGGDLGGARRCYEAALTADTSHALAYVGLGAVSREEKRLDEALDYYCHAIELLPESAPVHNGLAHVLADRDDHEAALASFRMAIACDPEFAEARWGYAMSQLPWVYDRGAQLSQYREVFVRELEALDGWFDEARSASAYTVVGARQPFLLAYQEYNNRDTLIRYGDLCARIMERWRLDNRIPPPCTGHRHRPRVGIVSAQIRSHSVWKAIVKGWFRLLDTDRIELQAYHLSTKFDEESAFAESRAQHFEWGAKPLEEWVRIICDQHPDVLIYPEIGMDPLTLQLASTRLAPIQAVSWGHPETSGLPTMDYYLSAEAFEPPAAEGNYSERLVKLAHLGCAYAPSLTEEIEPDWSAFGIASDMPILLCPGSPFKYLPQHDSVWVEIARRLERCQMVFFTSANSPVLSQKLKGRLEAVFEEAALDTQLIFVPWLLPQHFNALMRRAHAFLDTIGFSGFNTAIQAIEHGLPIVTRESRFMRGRFASGILRAIGVDELIAQSEEDYIALAVKLVSDDAYRKSMRRRIESARHQLFDDMVPIRELEDFIIDVVHRRSC